MIRFAPAMLTTFSGDCFSRIFQSPEQGFTRFSACTCDRLTMREYQAFPCRRLIPKSARFFPGPLTTQPMTATSKAFSYSARRRSTSRAIDSRSISVLPQVGRKSDQAVFAQTEAFQYFVADPDFFNWIAERNANGVPTPCASSAPNPTALFIEPLRRVPASVTPRWMG